MFDCSNANNICEKLTISINTKAHLSSRLFTSSNTIWSEGGMGGERKGRRGIERWREGMRGDVVNGAFSFVRNAFSGLNFFMIDVPNIYDI